MTHRLVALSVASLALLAPLIAPAQGLRPSTGSVVAASVEPPAASGLAADYIVAVVNSEPITNNEVRAATQRLQQQLAQHGRPAVDSRALAREVLERLINEKAQMQQARESGINADEAAIDQAEQNIAQQNQLTVPELRRRLAQQGTTPAQFRSQLRDQIVLARLREREVDARVRVSDLEVDQYLREQQSSNDPATQQINLAQILVSVPDTATPVQLAALQARAQRALVRAQAGEDFAALVREFSDASDNASLTQGGELGLRTLDRYPPLFLQATQNLALGELSALVRSGAGFHILKVVEKKSAALAAMTVTQSRARHILLRVSPQLSEGAARDKLNEFKKNIAAGKANFADLAREQSQDGSAAQGGDLGWASPGMFVPEFETVMNALEPGQISEPLVSRFGVHLIQLMERRQASLSPQEQRESVRAMLREKKLDETYGRWAQDVRGRAYVELREPPQ
ncbi:MAG: peptidylprolyl isomerase [Gammaproteobacteria bacterium]|uniref:peptidylprolyl isomerase n=1 Tax=Rhodoferax sp. TaxID=50421 RepID=UPI0017D62D3A|nr:peptidylprolyl isomerase [Rhodoferax sp.]MBU3899400.1 peptidylprolyl isomerase [Gammaproteobacteria bacterium]MBA3058420.1 molecular chaperone SurA [Rhodoferax sp.]MBU3997568.1 peptidylprolyl isomerase [Gammaproteobacteria bacterium]MBU4080655.1 peptidylprolyl isomerase [Gammaproteobacteria bacterium]MBU4113564.1 peptidylprolyl isomerase [Gammaproteobacteria bacterium]